MKRYPLSTVLTIVAFLSLVACLFVGRAPVPVAHGEFARLVSITGGSPAKRLMDSLVVAGYNEAPQIDEITLCVPSSNTNPMYVGSAGTVNNTNGFAIVPGDCQTYRAARRSIDVTRIYLYVATTESVAVSLR